MSAAAVANPGSELERRHVSRVGGLPARHKNRITRERNGATLTCSLFAWRAALEDFCDLVDPAGLLKLMRFSLSSATLT